jgi:hypothetical protein
LSVGWPREERVRIDAIGLISGVKRDDTLTIGQRCRPFFLGRARRLAVCRNHVQSPVDRSPDGRLMSSSSANNHDGGNGAEFHISPNVG